MTIDAFLDEHKCTDEEKESLKHFLIALRFTPLHLDVLKRVGETCEKLIDQIKFIV